jgi:excisionase family DNA binding protein
MSDRSPELGSRSTLMTVEEVAQDLRIGRTAVYALMDRGELPWLKIGRSRRIRRRDVEALVDSRIQGDGLLCRASAATPQSREVAP